MRTRRRLTEETCPKCGAPISVVEIGHTVGEEAEPIAWVIDTKRCSKGCLLTVNDLEPPN